MRTRGILLASAVTLSLVTGALWGALADDSQRAMIKGRGGGTKGSS